MGEGQANTEKGTRGEEGGGREALLGKPIKFSNMYAYGEVTLH